MPRDRLVRRLMSARDTALVLVVAPAGYGKTTLVSEWARRDPRPFTWVVPHEDENESFAEICDAVAGDGDGIVVVIDGVDLLKAPESFSMLSQLIEHQRPGCQVVVTSRIEPQLGLGGLRARRKLLEVRSSDLAMTPSEAEALMEPYGFDLKPAALEALVHRTEGWPAGLYLAALAAVGERDPAQTVANFAGDDRFVSDYIGDELLSELPADVLRFLARLSVLDSFSGPLCDFVLERTGSGRLLKTLSRTNLMLISLDRGDTTYRYHRLFAQALLSELRRVEPEVEPLLHARASAWYDERGDFDRSTDHAIAAGDIQLAGNCLWSRSAGMLGYGQRTKLRERLARFTEEQIAGHPALALTAAATSLVEGDRSLVDHWTAAALRGLDDNRSGNGQSALLGQVLLLRATVSEDLVGRMGERAELAWGAVPEASAWRALGNLLQGVARHLTGERECARALLEEGSRRSAAESPWMQSLCLAQLGLLAVEREDWMEAESLAARAKAQVERSGLAEYATSALVYAVSAEVQAHTGRIEASKAAAGQAGRLLSSLPDFMPWYAAECRIALARAALRLSDVHRARLLVSEAARELQRSPDADVAIAWVESCRVQVARSSASAAGEEWCLTTAELRILQFLPTHLSLREIADRLYVSANTVKTHARSVYRKLGASSRGDAVVRARKAGLLDEASHTGVAAAALGGLR